ncbi:MAG: energy-coupling factor transporter transmembrane component T [Conexivisphaerales archaeon]
MINIPEEGSSLGGVPFKLKVIMLALTSTFALVCWNPYLLVAGLALSSLPVLSVKSKKALVSSVKLFLLLSISFIISQSLFYWGVYSGERVTVLLYIFGPGTNPIVDALTMGRGIVITVQGIYWGIESAAKFGITYFSALGVLYTTRPSHILETVYGTRLPQFIKLSTIATFRVLPVMVEDMEAVISVARARRPAGLRKRLVEPFTVVRSMVFNSVKRAYHLSMALEIRGTPRIRMDGEKGNRFMTIIIATYAFIFILLIIASVY